MLSDLYAMGVVNCHNMLMLLATSKEFTEAERDVVIPLIMRGFQDTAREAGCLVTGGQTVVNPWCTVGGVASSVCRDGGWAHAGKAGCFGCLALTFGGQSEARFTWEGRWWEGAYRHPI